MSQRIPFENNRVTAKSVDDFIDRYYRHDRLGGRGAEYEAIVRQSHREYFEKYGYDIISRYESMTGEVVALFPDGIIA